MPQVLVLAVAGVGLYAGYRWARRKVMHAAREAAAAKTKGASGTPRPAGTLVEDEATGKYRVRD